MKEMLLGTFGIVFINNLVVIYSFSLLHRTFYQMKKWAMDRSWLVVLIYILDFLLLSRINEMRMFLPNIIFNVVCFFLPLFIMYDVNNYRGIAYYFFWMVGSFAIELVTAAYSGSLRNGSYDGTTYYDGYSFGSVVIVTLLELVLALVICNFGNKDRSQKFDKITLVFATMPLSTVILIVVDHMRLLRLPNSAYNEDQYLSLVIILVLVNIVFFIVLEKYTNLMKKEFGLKMNEMQLKADTYIMEIAANSMRERLKNAEEMIQQDRTMRHDRRHFEALLLSLAQEGNLDEIKKCLEERMLQEPHLVVHYCDNTTVNAAITHYVEMAKKEKITVNVSANIPAVMEVDEIQLAITISNLLENAIHGCMKVPEDDRTIDITAKYKKQLLLEITNTCDGTASFDEDGYPITSKEGHGTGTRSVLAFVNKTDSDIRYKLEDGKFKVRMIING